MPRITREHGFEVWTITAPDRETSASFVPALGGLGSSLVMPAPGGPRELLYRHPFFWESRTREIRGGWPFLFPICGRLEAGGEAEKYRWNGADYYLPIHGFAPNVAWRALASTHPSELVMELFDTDSTRVRYPFNFRVTLRYRVEPGVLRCRLTVKNESPGPMPYYAGFHPYFLTPPPGAGKEEVRVEFRAAARLRYNESLTEVTDEEEPVGSPLTITAPEVNEMLSRLGDDREVRLCFPDGCTIHIKEEAVGPAHLFSYLQFYTMPDRPFFCIEPWMGYPNQLNHPEQVHLLPPGVTDRTELRLWVTENGSLR